MADPAASAASSDVDLDDLYADLDDQVAAALATRDSSDPATDAEASANEAVDLGDGPSGYSSSEEESEDDIHIVLNEDGGASPRPSAVRYEERRAEGSEEREVLGSLVKGLYNDGDLSTFSELHCKGFFEKRSVPITRHGDGGQQHAFQKDFYFFLPRNRTVFDINIEAFQQKPWRQPGVDLSEYFNFGLDEEGWTKYCFSMKQFRQGARSLAKQPSRLDQPKGKAIHVEAGEHERYPSSDMWCPRQRDSDVIQVNTMLSPSNHSTSDDNSTVNYKHVTTERIFINNSRDKHVKDTSFMVDRVDKEAHSGGSSDCIGSKRHMRDSACTRDRSSSPDYSGLLYEESAEDYHLRVNRHSNSNTFCEDIKHRDGYVKSDFCHHLSKSDQQSKKGGCHCCTRSPNYDRCHKTKLLRTDEPPFVSSGLLVDSRNDHHLLRSVHKAIKEQKRHCSVRGRHAAFQIEKQEEITDNYPGRYARKYGQKRSSPTSLRNNNRNAFHNQVREKQDRLSVRNDAEYFSDDFTHERRRSSWHELNDGEYVVECFSSAKGWKQHQDHVSMLEAERSGDTDGLMYRERHYHETRRHRRVRHGRREDEEFLHYTDFRFAKLQNHGKYRNRRLAESGDEHLKRPDHFMLSPGGNDHLENSEGGWPSYDLTFKNSRNRCIDKKRILNAKMMACYRDGDRQKNKQHDSSFHVDSIQQSVFDTVAAVDTGCSILPVKRRLHGGLAFMKHKKLVGLPFPKGKSLTHDQSIANDRMIYGVEPHNSLKEIDREAIFSFNDMRNNKTISNIYDERRNERLILRSKETDSIHLNNRKSKFKQQGSEINRRVEIDNIGPRPADKDDLQQKVQKFKRSYHHSGNKDLEKPTYQIQQSAVDINQEYELEEGELIEQDNEDTVSKVQPKKPRKAVLKSVIEATAGQLGLINAMTKDAVCSKIAERGCDNKHILEVMEKMQKRRERFSEPITQKEGHGSKELLDVTCGADDIKNQRPARKRRWGGSG